MKADCHIHMVLDGYNWKEAILRHQEAPDEAFIRQALRTYQQEGYTYLRDGGDRWGVGKKARELALQYGITYKTPLAPLCMAGHYGGFIGKKFEDFRQYRELVVQNRQEGADFIKVMISGIMDFDHFGVMSQPGLRGEEIREMVHIAHEEGMAVMAHANGARVVEAAARAGVDSVEHGAYLDGAAMAAMAENGTVWVPTLSTIGNLLGKGRFDDRAVRQILDSALYNLRAYSGFVAPGTDAGAWAVPHGVETERRLLAQAGIGEDRLEAGLQALRSRFG